MFDVELTLLFLCQELLGSGYRDCDDSGVRSSSLFFFSTLTGKVDVGRGRGFKRSGELRFRLELLCGDLEYFGPARH